MLKVINHTRILFSLVMTSREVMEKYLSLVEDLMGRILKDTKNQEMDK